MKKNNISNQILVPQQIIFLNYNSLEESYRDKTTSLGWGDYTDVLYSFLGIFVLGVYIFARDKKKYSIGEDNIIRLAGTKKWLYSRNYIKENISEFSELVTLKELNDFAKVYNSIGNIIPIWPGGNVFKAKSGCYDIPDIFFSNYMKMEKVYIQHYLNKELKNVALTRFDTNLPFYVNEIGAVLKYSTQDYKRFVQHIVNEIKQRAKEIEVKL